MSRVIPPGSTLGVLGSGQLGRMFAIAARRMGYRVHVLSPDAETPTGQVADFEIRAAYDDVDAVADFARRVDVVTFEFENVPAQATETAARYAPVRPDGSVLHTTQNRLREKQALERAGLPVTPFAAVESAGGLRRAVERLVTPAVLKTASWGYDGKGQRLIRAGDDLEAAWAACGGEAILEAFVDFEQELSVIGARGLDGSTALYGPIANTHHRHILDVSVVPAGLDPRVESEAIGITRAILEHLDLVGVLCVEFFLARDGRLMVNELAPRPHNSGHLTIDAYVACQFEQQVRAVCGLPLGSPRLLSPAAMANLLGDLWEHGPPNWARALEPVRAADGTGVEPAASAKEAVSRPDDSESLFEHAAVKLHLYGKQDPRPGRKMGHLTALAETPAQAAHLVRQARAALSERRA